MSRHNLTKSEEVEIALQLPDEFVLDTDCYRVNSGIVFLTFREVKRNTRVPQVPTHLNVNGRTMVVEHNSIYWVSNTHVRARYIAAEEWGSASAD